jgi:hypothetical protein
MGLCGVAKSCFHVIVDQRRLPGLRNVDARLLEALEWCSTPKGPMEPQEQLCCVALRIVITVLCCFSQAVVRIVPCLLIKWRLSELV